MAFTKLYLTTATAPYTPATIRGAWDKTSGAITKAFDVQKIGGGNITWIAASENDAAANYDVLFGRWVSGPVAAQTFSGTLNAVLGLWESNAAADFALHIHAYVTQGDSDTPRGTLLNDYVETTANEFPTAEQGRTFASAQTVAGVVASAGDRIVIEVGYVALNASATNYTAELNYGTIVVATGSPAADLTSGGSVVTLTGFFEFSVSVTEATNPLRESQAVVEVLANDTPSLRHSQTVIEALWAPIPSLRHSQTVVEVLWLYRPAPGGGGGVIPGDPPATAILGTESIRLFGVITVESQQIGFAETQLNDPLSWYAGPKAPWLLSCSPIERSLGESPQGVEVQLVLADTDRVFRTLATTGTLSGSTVHLYLVDDTTRYALGAPYRIFAGKVTTHRAVPGFRYELVLRDILSEQIADLLDAPRIPPERLTVAVFPGLASEYEGRAIPIVLGQCNDESEDGNIPKDPQGVIPPMIVGGVNFTYFGGTNTDVVGAIWSHGALPANGLWTIYFNQVANPYVRILVPTSEFGVTIWAPGFPGWADTGIATDYVDYPTSPAGSIRRYTPLYVLASHPNAQAWKDGQILVAANIYGVSENGDGTGLYLSDAPRIYQWLLSNFLFSTYTYGNYAALPTFDEGYSVLNTVSVEAAVTRLRGFGGGAYPVGFMLGRGGQQQTLRHVLTELCSGVAMEQGIDRHGRLMINVEDPSAAAVVNLSDLFDIEDSEFEVWVDRAAYKNTIEYVHGYRYVPPSAPVSTPATGDALPSLPVSPYLEWTSGLRVETHTAALAANGGVVRKSFRENYVVRSAAVAQNVEARRVAQAVGPTPRYDGPRMFRLRTSWQGLYKNGVEVELGTVIAIDHLEGLGATGYEGQTARVLRISVDPQQARVTLDGRILFAA